MPRIDVPHPDSAVMSGFPGNGDPIDLNPATDPAPPPAPEPPEDPTAKQLRELQARLDRQDQELQHLRRATPPPQPKEPAPAAEDDPDWDNEFFTSPKKALVKFGERLAKDITQSLTGQYQRDRSTQAFWEGFYEKHPDLKTDHDLVDLTLKSNLAEMSSMPVDRAMERLADLTRERILRYAGGAGKPRAPKPRVEGASSAAPPAKPAKPAESDKILSITDIIKDRKAQRRKAVGA